jgi:hypothetical protein
LCMAGLPPAAQALTVSQLPAMLLRLRLFILTVALIACAGSGCTNGSSASHDARGRLVGNALVSVGGGERDPLYHVVGAVLLDSQLIVANGGSRALHFYDLDGHLTRVAGRQGDGPGEFQQIYWIQAVASDLAVYDRELTRLSMFTDSGDFVGSVQISVPDAYSAASALGVFPDGSILVHAWPRVRRPAIPVYRDTLALLRYDSLGHHQDSLGSYRWVEYYRESMPRGGAFASPLPFGRWGVIVVRGWRYYVMENDTFVITVHDSAGKTRNELRPASRRPLVSVTETDARIAREHYASPEAPPELRLVERFDRMPLPSTFPPYGWMGRHGMRILQVSHGGDAWALEFGGLRDAGPVWTVFGPDGSVRSRVTADEELELLDVRDDVAVVRRWDDQDVEWIELRRIVW